MREPVQLRRQALCVKPHMCEATWLFSGFSLLPL